MSKQEKATIRANRPRQTRLIELYSLIECGATKLGDNNLADLARAKRNKAIDNILGIN